jgi:hypothetical protein
LILALPIRLPVLQNGTPHAMENPGKINRPNLIGSLALLACAALSGLFMLLPGEMRLGDTRMTLRRHASRRAAAHC